jgi:catalase
MVGNNTPIFFIRDPEKFPDFIHTQKRNPQTNLKDPDAFWDFASLVPESIHQFSFLFSDRGIPASYRHMNGFSSHAYKWVSAKGQGYWVKLHYKTDQGIKNLTAEQAADVEGSGEFDSSTRDLFQSIQQGNFPSWTAYVQLMPMGEEAKYQWNIFDVTKVWPHGDYPLIPYGKLVLNRNPDNYFAEVEQAAFAPSHLVPGVEPSLDRMLQGRLFSYADTHRHRLGSNYLMISINCPYASKISNQQRDGFMTVNGNQGSAPNYEPNSHTKTHANAVEDKTGHSTLQAYQVDGAVGRYPFQHPNSDYEQPGVFYRRVLKEEEKQRLCANIGGHLCVARPEVQKRMLAVFEKVDPDYAKRVAAELLKHNNQNILS